VLRLIHDSTWVTLPTIPSLIHFLASCKTPELSPLQSDLDDAAGLCRRGQTLLRFKDWPGHSLLGVKIFPRRQGIEKMSSVHVQRAGNDDLNILHVQQSPMIIECVNAGDLFLDCIAAPAGDVRHGR
jgi:hypothetical protein